MVHLHLIVPTLILLVGVANDLYSRKFKNSFFLAALGVALIYQIAFFGFAGLTTGGLGLLAALLITLPMVLGGVLGAGDMKLLMAFGLSVDSRFVISTVLGALIWGALLGLARAALAGQLLQLLKNTGTMILTRTGAPTQSAKIPFAVALMFGWMTCVVLEVSGGSL